jgi:hypothetical protein
MNVKEIEAAALGLPEEERARLGETLLASVRRQNVRQLPPGEEDPIWSLGQDPVDTGLGDASVNLDAYLYRAAE